MSAAPVKKDHGANIPPGEFKFAYDSEDWSLCWLNHYREFNRPEKKENRLRAQRTGLPKDLELWKLVRGIRFLDREFCTRLNQTSHAKDLAAFPDLQKFRDELKDAILSLGYQVADALIRTDAKFIADLKKTMAALQDPSLDTVSAWLGKEIGGDRKTVTVDILQRYDELCRAWFPNGEAFPLITKAALRESLFPRVSPAEKREFTAKLKELGLSKLPERGAGGV